MKWKYKTTVGPIGTLHGIYSESGDLICWLSAAQIQHASVIEAALDNAEKLGYAREIVCKKYCPTVWKTDEAQPHSDECKALEVK